jgi:hypothetical protein
MLGGGDGLKPQLDENEMRIVDRLANLGSHHAGLLPCRCKPAERLKPGGTSRLRGEYRGQ